MFKRTNENCLAGYECPKCKSQGPFWFNSMSWARWTDDGTEEPTDFEILLDGRGLCESCGYKGFASKFKVDK